MAVCHATTLQGVEGLAAFSDEEKCAFYGNALKDPDTPIWGPAELCGGQLLAKWRAPEHKWKSHRGLKAITFEYEDPGSICIYNVV